MKKNYFIILMGIVLATALVSCDKDKNDGGKQSVIRDGKIMLTASYDAPKSNTKYSFNIDNLSCFFDLGDSVYVNGLPYAVFPYETDYPETDSASAHARIWADISSSGVYKALYPKSAFTNFTTDIDHPSVFIPDTVKPIPTETFAMGATFALNPATDGRSLPTTAYVTDDDLDDNLQFHNTMGMILFSMKYNYRFGSAIESAASSSNGYPYIEVTRIEITTPAYALTGSGTITNPYSDTPVLTLNSNGNHTIIYDVENSTGIPPQPRANTDYVYLPIVPLPATTATITFYFTTHFVHTGSVRHFRYTKTITNGLHVERNTITNVIIGLSTQADFNNYCTEL